MNIKSLTPKQRKTLEGLAKLGRPAKRLEIAQSGGIDGTQAAHALSRLKRMDFVKMMTNINGRLPMLENRYC